MRTEHRDNPAECEQGLEPDQWIERPRLQPDDANPANHVNDSEQGQKHQGNSAIEDMAKEEERNRGEQRIRDDENPER